MPDHRLILEDIFHTWHLPNSTRRLQAAMNKTDCFKHYGIKPRNIRWSWSGVSSDGQTVAVALWNDRFSSPNFGTYGSASHTTDAQWFDSNGHRELIRNLAWAKEHCDGIVRVILVFARDVKVEPRSVRTSIPRDDLRMKVAKLDEITKEFLLERVMTARL